MHTTEFRSIFWIARDRESFWQICQRCIKPSYHNYNKGYILQGNVRRHVPDACALMWAPTVASTAWDAVLRTLDMVLDIIHLTLCAWWIVTVILNCIPYVCSFFTSKSTKLRLEAGYARTRWRTSQRFPDTLVRWKGRERGEGRHEKREGWVRPRWTKERANELIRWFVRIFIKRCEHRDVSMLGRFFEMENSVRNFETPPVRFLPKIV